jgi:hypothetical protein
MLSSEYNLFYHCNKQRNINDGSSVDVHEKITCQAVLINRLLQQTNKLRGP